MGEHWQSNKPRLPRLTPPTFCQPWSRFPREAMLRKALSGLEKRRQQPERYTPFFEFFAKIL
jgi:hypothetical protein